MDRLRRRLIPAVLLVLIPLVCFAAQAGQEQPGLLERAAEFYARERFIEALELYRQYLITNPSGPRSAEAAFRAGDCLLAAGRFSGAVDAYNSALEKFGDSPEAAAGLVGLGRAKLRQGLVHEAEGHFQDALARSPDPRRKAEIELLLGTAYYENSEYSQAAGLLRSAVGGTELEADRAGARLKLADCYYQLGDYQHARETFSRLLDTNPELMDGQPELAFRWAEVLYFSGQYDPAGIVLEDILNDYPTHPVRNHALLRLGDLERNVGLQTGDPQRRSLQMRKAIGHYSKLLLVSDLHRRAADDAGIQLSDVALLKIIQTADIARLDLQQDLSLRPAAELLEEVISRGLRPEMNALAHLLLARQQLREGRGLEALNNYRILLTDFAGFEVARSARPEYEAVARDLMDKSYEVGDYPAFVDIFTRDGGGLLLSQRDRLRLADSYYRVQIYDRAELIYRELVLVAEETSIRRFATIGLARVRAAQGDREGALKALGDFLKLELSPAEREDALLLVIDILYRMGDIEELRAWWRERSPELITPRLRATVMFRLAMLAKRIGESGEALEMFERFLLEFGDGVPGSAAVYGYLRDSYLALGDLYYDGGQIKMAAGYYELYIALFGDSEDIAFPLFQSANCHLRLGERALAASIYRELIRLYPDSSWSAQARVNLESLEPAQGPGGRRRQ